MGEFGIQFGAGKAAVADPVVAAKSKAASKTVKTIFDMFLTVDILSLYTFAPPVLRELTHIPVPICPLLLISMFDANIRSHIPYYFHYKNN